MILSSTEIKFFFEQTKSIIKWRKAVNNGRKKKIFQSNNERWRGDWWAMNTNNDEQLTKQYAQLMLRYLPTSSHFLKSMLELSMVIWNVLKDKLMQTFNGNMSWKYRKVHVKIVVTWCLKKDMKKSTKGRSK